MRVARRRGLMGKAVVGLVAAAMMLAAVPVHAEPPHRVKGARTVAECGFEVLIEFEGKEKFIELDGRLHIIAPGQKATLTNLETGASTRVNISGPATITDTPTADGGFVSELRGRGNWVHTAPGRLWHTSGLWTQWRVFDADGNLVDAGEDFSRTRSVDLCDALS